MGLWQSIWERKKTTEQDSRRLSMEEHELRHARIVAARLADKVRGKKGGQLTTVQVEDLRRVCAYAIKVRP